MIRLRYKVGALFMAVAVTGIGATTLVTTRIFVADKHAYVMELSSTAAPYIAAAIGKQLEFIRDELSSLEQSLGVKGTETARAGLLRSAFGRMRGATRLEVYDGHGLAASLAAADEPPVANAPARLLARNESQFLEAGAPPRFLSRIGGHTYVVTLSPAIFARFLELSSAFSVNLVSREAIEPLGGPNTAAVPAAVAGEIWKSLFESGKQAVLAREIVTPGGALLAAASPVPGLDGQAILVHAPSSQVGQMIRQVLRAALPYVAVVLFLALAMGLLFSDRIVSPIEEVTMATSRIAGGEWNVPLVRRRPKDEIGVLVRSFSRMGHELSERENALKNAHEELRRSERLSSLGRLSAGIAHEVKNPLNAILGYAQLIERKLPREADEAVPKYLGFVMDETRRASKIISDLLTFARQKPPTLSRQELEPILVRALDLAQPQIAAAGISVQRSCAEAGLSAAVDPDQILQVLLNLIINASHALEEVESGRPREIGLTLDRKDGFARILVRDTGTGISPENLARIFEPFFSTKQVGKGTGLGLALCHGIIEQHGGRIEVASTVGQGTTFTILLPSIT